MEFWEYLRELKLAEQQYGQEEELYPLINMLLRECGNVKDLSIRTVAGGKSIKNDQNRKRLSMYISFPDLVILDEGYGSGDDDQNLSQGKMYGCIEAKEFIQNGEIHNLIDLKMGDSLELTEFGYEDMAILRVKGERFGYICAKCKADCDCINDRAYKKYVDMDNKKILSLFADEDEIRKYSSKGKTNEAGSFKRNAAHQIKINRYLKFKIGDTPISEEDNYGLSQLISELLWYGKVIYTNGLDWRYMELVQPQKTSISDKLKFSDGNTKDWICALNTLNDPKETVKIFNVKIADLTKTYKSARSLPIKELSKISDDPEWRRLKVKLSKIKWKDNNKFEEFYS